MSNLTNNTSELLDILAAVNALPEAGKPPVLQEKSNITPTKSQQTITPDSGYDGLSKVIVDKIPDEYVIPSGTKDITANGNDIDVANYAKVNVNVESSGGGGNTDIEDGLISRTITGAYSNNRITNIGQYALGNCEHLTSVDFPLVTDVANYALRGCTKLAAINFPLVQTIGNYGFYQCALTRVEFPVLTKIGAYGLGGCANLETVIIRSTKLASMTANTALQGTKIASGSGYVYVPSALVNSYKSASNWSAYAAQIRAIEDYPAITGG